MAYVKFPTIEQLLADPNKWGEYFTKVAPHGYSIYSRLKEYASMYGMQAAQASLNREQEQLNYQLARIDEERYNILNAGHDVNDMSGYLQKDLNNRLEEARKLQQSFAPELRGEPVPTYQQALGIPVKDPYGTQVVGQGGQIITPSTFGTQTQTPTTGTTTSSVSMQKGNEVVWVPQSQVAAYQAQGYSTSGNLISGTNAGTNAGTSSGTVTAASDSNSGVVDKQWVDALYKKYFDRSATSSELANWTKETPQALEQFLLGESRKFGYTSEYFKQQEKTSTDAALKTIQDSDLPPEIKDLFSYAVKIYPQGIEYNSQEIINTFNKIKESTIDPYFKELSDIAINDLKTAITRQNEDNAMTNEQVNTITQQNVDTAKSNLEQAGMTFSGEGIKQLGEKSVYTPFGGIEGSVNQSNRLLVSSTALNQKRAMEDLIRTTEKNVGSNALSGYNTSGGITGTLQTQKQQQYGQSLNQIIENYRSKQAALTTKNYLT